MKSDLIVVSIVLPFDTVNKKETEHCWWTVADYTYFMNKALTDKDAYLPVSHNKSTAESW